MCIVNAPVLKKGNINETKQTFFCFTRKMQHYSDCTFILVREQLALLPA